MNLRLLLLLLAMLLAGANLLSAAERVALVVGCGNYKADPDMVLETPVQDAQDLATMLSSPALGFEVIPVVDATAEDFYAGLRKFKKAARGARVALVYFSGHGIEHEGQNYLVPVNAVLDTEEQLETQTINLEHVLKELAATNATVKVAVLDCCRNNPFRQTKSWMRSKSVASTEVLRALGDAEIPQATLVCFATSAGRKAAAVLHEGSKNSPFTEFFLDELSTPGRSLQAVFENVHDRMKKATQGRQVPSVRTDNDVNELFRETVLVSGQPPVNGGSPPPAEPPPVAEGIRRTPLSTGPAEASHQPPGVRGEPIPEATPKPRPTPGAFVPGPTPARRKNHPAETDDPRGESGGAPTVHSGGRKLEWISLGGGRYRSPLDPSKVRVFKGALSGEYYIEAGQKVYIP